MGDHLVIIIGGDEEIVFLIRFSLASEEFNIKIAQNGVSGLGMVKDEIPDLIILHRTLPDIDGLEICKEIRMDPRTAHIPIIIVTEKIKESNGILGLECGADDFIIRPFSSRDLLAKARAILRRVSQKKDISKLIYKSILIDTAAYEVRDGDSEVVLTAKEYMLLVFLVRNRGHVMSRRVILESVWGLTGPVTTRTVDNHIRNLRKKIPILAESIVTIKQFGYKLKEE